MELQIGIDEFSRALYRAQGIVEKKSTMPILASVLLEATQGEGGGRLRVSAFDLEIGVTGTHPAEVQRAGSVALKHKELYDNVRMVATDGHRLSLVERPAAGNFNMKKGVIVPRKGLFELRRLLGEESTGACELGFTESSGVFRRGDLTMVMRLIDGVFPDYMQVIPKEADRTVPVDRPRLLDTLKRMSILSGDRSTNAVKLELQKDMLRVTSQNPDLGDAKEEIPVAYGGTPLQIGFNARYLMDVLSVVEAPQMNVELCDELSPGVLKPIGEAGASTRYTAVIMPMRI